MMQTLSGVPCTAYQLQAKSALPRGT